LDLPEIDLHDVRHSYATAGRDAKIDWKALSKRIGHADGSGSLLRVLAMSISRHRSWDRSRRRPRVLEAAAAAGRSVGTWQGIFRCHQRSGSPCLASGFPSAGGLTHHQVTELVLRHLPILMAGQ
jgi:hypothetical protein